MKYLLYVGGFTVVGLFWLTYIFIIYKLSTSMEQLSAGSCL